MKKVISVILTLAICFGLCTAVSGEQSGEISVYINGTLLQTDVPPMIVEGRTLLPLRAVAESIGMAVEWNGETQEVRLTKDNSVITLTIGNSRAVVGGNLIYCEVPPRIFSGRTLVPVRFIAESFGLLVNWDSSERAVYIIAPGENCMAVHFLDVGQGDCSIIQLPDGKNIIIDAGEPASEKDIIEYAEKLGIVRFDYVIATHLHSDHIGGLGAIVEMYEIGEIYMPGVEASTKVYENLMNCINEKGSKVTRAGAGMTMIDEAGLRAEFVAPVSEKYAEMNNYSLVLLLSYGDMDFLFTGDAEKLSEKEIREDIDSEVLKVGHHGADTSSAQEFVDRVTPEYSVISVGEGNSYGHPDAETVERLENAESVIYRTDKHGDIVFVTEGKSLFVYTEKDWTEETDGDKSPEAEALTEEALVYVTRSGTVYHKSDCSSIKNSTNIIKITLEEAKKSYTPCKRCKPAA